MMDQEKSDWRLTVVTYSVIAVIILTTPLLLIYSFFDRAYLRGE